MLAYRREFVLTNRCKVAFGHQTCASSVFAQINHIEYDAEMLFVFTKNGSQRETEWVSVWVRVCGGREGCFWYLLYAILQFVAGENGEIFYTFPRTCFSSHSNSRSLSLSSFTATISIAHHRKKVLLHWFFWSSSLCFWQIHSFSPRLFPVWDCECIYFCINLILKVKLWSRCTPGFCVRVCARLFRREIAQRLSFKTTHRIGYTQSNGMRKNDWLLHCIGFQCWEWVENW